MLGLLYPSWPPSLAQLSALALAFLAWPLDVVEVAFWGLLALFIPGDILKRVILCTASKELFKLFIGRHENILAVHRYAGSGRVGNLLLPWPSG